MSMKALLMILDGWGIGDQGKDDVIFNTPTPYWDSQGVIDDSLKMLDKVIGDRFGLIPPISFIIIYLPRAYIF